MASNDPLEGVTREQLLERLGGLTGGYRIVAGDARPSFALKFVRSTRWRMLHWFIAAAVAAGVTVVWVRHPTLQTLITGPAKLCVGAALGYWFHRTAHRNYRPDDQPGGIAKAAANVCKAFIIGCSILAMAMVMS